jgi:hypothetical protein
MTTVLETKSFDPTRKFESGVTGVSSGNDNEVSASRHTNIAQEKRENGRKDIED